jgi:hypothetical protein
VIKLTIDTMIVRDFLDPSRPNHSTAVELFRLDEVKLCELRVVSRVKADINGGPLREELEALEIYRRPMIPTIGQWDLSDWGEDFWATDEQVQEFDALLKLVFPLSDHSHREHRNRVIDIGHLLGHKLAGRDLFLSNEKAFFGQAVALERNFSIRVMKSANAVEVIGQRL